MGIAKLDGRTFELQYQFATYILINLTRNTHIQPRHSAGAIFMLRKLCLFYKLTLMDLNLTEKKLMDEGMPLKAPFTWNPVKKEFEIDPLKNVHDKANVSAPQPKTFLGYDMYKEYIDNVDEEIYY